MADTTTPTSRLAPMGGTALSSDAPRIIASTEGVEGCGKSHFALSAPKPLAYFVVGDRGFETSNPDVPRLLQLDEVDGAEYAFTKADAGPDMDSTALAKACDAAAWRPFRADYTTALTKGRPARDAKGRPTGQWERYRSIVVDTAGGAWETCRLARFGKLEQVPPNLYTPVNAEFRNYIIRAAFKSDCNVIFVHQIGDEYINKVNEKGKEIGIKTGRQVRKGFKTMGYDVPIVLRHMRDLTLPIPDRYGIEVLKCALNPELEGVTFNGLDFAQFATFVYPDTTREYWGGE